RRRFDRRRFRGVLSVHRRRADYGGGAGRSIRRQYRFARRRREPETISLLLSQLGANHRRTVGERLQFGKRQFARKVLHAAIRRGYETIRAEIFERRSNAIRDDGRRLRYGRGEIDHAQHDLLRREILQHAEIEFRLRRFDRNLVRLARAELAEERIADRFLALDDRRVTETAMYDRRRFEALERAVDRLDRDAFCGRRILAQP